jgi:hypothetical protein
VTSFMRPDSDPGEGTGCALRAPVPQEAAHPAALRSGMPYRAGIERFSATYDHLMKATAGRPCDAA